MYSVELEDCQSSIVNDINSFKPLEQEVNLNNTKNCSSCSIPDGGKRYSPQRPDRLWGPPILLYNGYQGLFPWG
jgi:hypothetical protein